MKHLLRAAMMIAVGFALCNCARAQAPEWEIFGGYSYSHVNAGTPIVIGSTSIPLTVNANGWHASVAENVTSWFGGVADFSGSYANKTVNLVPLGGAGSLRINASAYPFLFGPQFYYRKLHSATLFGHVLFGGVDARANIPGGTAVSQTSWAYAGGGGIDYALSRYLSVRAQGDYIRTHFPETLIKDSQENYRASIGLVLSTGTVQH